MQRQTVLSDNDFPKVLPSPSGYVHHSFLNNTAWELDGPTHLAAVAALGLYAPRFSLTPWIFSWYYELWMVKDLNSLQSYTEKHCLWTDWHSLMKFSTKWWTTAHPYLQRRSLWWMLLFYSILITSLASSYQVPTANCGNFQNSVTCKLFSLVLPLSQLFLNVLQPHILLFFIFTKYNSVWQWKHCKCFLCTFICLIKIQGT